MYTLTWAALTAAFAATEATAIARGDWSGTFTENVRKLFHTTNKTGRVGFMVSWSVFSIWFFGHILEMWP
jgi:hypothetical protein